MSNDQVMYISETLLASAFYYGVAGGVTGYLFSKVLAFAFSRVKRAFAWR